MADLEKSVAIIFEGVDQMGAGVDSVTKRIDGIADGVQGATQPLADLTLGIVKFEGALLAAGAAATAFAIKLAGDFDTQFREISTLIDAPAEALQGFRGELLAYGQDSTQSLDQVNAAVYSAISAGADYTDSLDLVRQAEQLAVAGRAELSESNTLLVSTLNAYGESAEEAERYSDILFQTVREGQTTIPELAASLSQVTGIAAAGGVSFEEISAAIAALTAAGAPTSQAITQIRGAISAILKPTADAAGLADELGIEFNAAALETKGLSGVLADAAEATGGSTEQMARLFGSVEALNGVLTLTGAGADKFESALTNIEGSAGATAEAYQKMADDVENGSQRIRNAITTALVGVGTPLLDEFGGIQNAIAEIFQAIGASVEGGQLQGFVDELEGLFQGIETTLREVAANLPEALEAADFSSFFDGINAIKEAVAGLFDGADLTSADGLASVIETLGLGFEALAQYTAGAIEGIGPFLEQLASLTQWFLELDPALFAAAGTIGGVAVALNTASTALLAFNGPLRSLAGSGGLLPKATSAIGGLAGVLTGPAGLAALAGLAATGFVRMGSDLYDTVTGKVDPATQAIIDQNQAIDDGRLVWDVARKEWVAAGEAQETLAGQVERWNDELQDAFIGVARGTDDLADHRRALEEVNGKYTDWETVVDDAWKSSESFRQEQEATADALRDQLATIGPVENAWKQVSAGVFEAGTNIGALEEAYGEVQAKFDQGLITQAQFDEITDYYNQLKSGADTAGKTQQQLADSVLTTEDAILEARKAVLDYELQWEELASNERIKSLELGVQLQTAKLEADTQRIEAAFESINVGIQSTGDTLGSFWSLLGSGDLSRFQELDLEKQIDQEQKYRQQQFDLQKKETEALIENLQARTKALQSGEGLIKIESDGLEPALETIMWQIIEKVQMRANAEGAEFLLGI